MLNTSPLRQKKTMQIFAQMTTHVAFLQKQAQIATNLTACQDCKRELPSEKFGFCIGFGKLGKTIG
jgi:hypothetical protein